MSDACLISVEGIVKRCANRYAAVGLRWWWLGFACWVLPLRLLAGEMSRPKVEVTSDDGKTSIELHLAMQLRWEYAWLDRGGDEARTSRNQLLLRRIRPTACGRLMSEDLSWLLHLSVAPGALELMDLWLDYRLHPWLQVRVGQMKIPLSRYRLNSFQDRPVVEWSHPTHYFGGERQIGAMLHNNVFQPPPYELQLGVFTGVNARAANGIGMEKTYAEPAPNPSSLTDPAPLQQMHTEIVAHLAYNVGDIRLRRPSDLEGGALRYSVGLSAALDLDPRPLHDHRLRLVPEAELRAWGLALGGQLYLGWFDQVAGADTYRLGMLGALVYVSYAFDPRYEIALRYAWVGLLEALRDDAKRHAEDRIAAAPDPQTAQALEERYALTGRLIAEHELTLGFDVYLFGTAAKWQIDAGLVLHELSGETRLDAQLRAQIQLAF